MPGRVKRKTKTDARLPLGPRIRKVSIRFTQSGAWCKLTLVLVRERFQTAAVAAGYRNDRQHHSTNNV